MKGASLLDHNTQAILRFPDADGAEAMGALPEWDLSDLYGGIDSNALAKDIERAKADAKRFADRLSGKVGDLDGAAMARAIAEFEAIQEILASISSYAQLRRAGAVDDPEVGRFFQTTQEIVNGISASLLFFPLEIDRLSEDRLNVLLAVPALARYRPWLRDQRAMRPHRLSDDLEKLLHEKAVAGANAWVRLFDETLSDLRFSVDGRDCTLTETLHCMTAPEAAMRKAAAEGLGAGIRDKAQLFALIANTLAKDKEIEDRWRRFDRPISARNLANRVEDEVVDALIGAVRGAYPGLSHRYYRWKARQFGSNALNYWDRNAPLPTSDETVIPWPEATESVLAAYAGFSRELADVARPFFDNRWIDAPARAGKMSGAFAHPTVPSAHPYLLLNYQGRTRDVMTLAHELGHGCHQVLAGAQGYLMADTPLTLAETASVFGEMLTFRALLARQSDPKRKQAMLAGKVEDMLNTVTRQIAMCEFERIAHEERRDGELSVDRLCEIWMQTQTESLGPALKLDGNYRYFWAYIPHFIHVPFYVYAYAFGDCLVNSLYAAYEAEPEGFADRYLDLLRAGGTLRHKDLLAPFGLDASRPDFWVKGLGLISTFIDELEAA